MQVGCVRTVQYHVNENAGTNVNIVHFKNVIGGVDIVSVASAVAGGCIGCKVGPGWLGERSVFL